LLALAEAHQRSGERAPARDAALQAADLARALGDGAALAAAALRLGAEFTFGHVDPTLVSSLEDALGALPEGPSLMRARVTARLAAARQPAPDPDAQIALAREAAAMARGLGDKPTLAAVLRDGRSAYLPMDSLDERTALDLETLALAHAAGDTLAALHTQARLFSDRLESGELDAALGHLDAHDELAEQRRESHRLWWSRYQRASIFTIRGRFDEAERLLEAGDASLEQTHDPLAPLARGGHWATFAVTSTRPVDFAALGQEMEAAARALPPRNYEFWELGFRCQAGQLDVVKAGLHRPTVRDLHPRFTGSHMLGEMARLADDRELAAITYERMRPWARRLTNTFVGSGGFYSLPLARLAQYLGRPDEARAWFEMALADHRRIGVEPWVAHTAADFATLLLGTGGAGDGRRASELLGEARVIADRLGMPGLREQTRSRGGEVSPPSAVLRAPSAVALPDDAFVLEGEYWTVRFDRGTYRFKDSKGMQILAHLIRNPGREFHVLQLIGVADGVESGEEIVEGAAAAAPDAEARAAYRARAEDLRDDLREAEANGDIGRAAVVHEELELLASELARGMGLGGRERKTGSAAERARVNVQRRLADAMKKIDEACAPLGRLLGRSIRTGAYCAYEP
jgi:tetratricopeptide (TPR) repeat protein